VRQTEWLVYAKRPFAGPPQVLDAVDLGVVFQLALAFETRVERLPRISIAVSIRFQHAPATVRQKHRLFTISRDANGFDQTLFA